MARHESLVAEPRAHRFRDAVRELVALHPAPGAWVAATQAAVAVAVLPAVFTIAGELQQGLLGSFGALIVLYLSDRSRQERAAKLPVLAAVLIAAAILGVFTGGTLLTSLTVVCAVALVGAFASLAFAVGPPGAIFPVLIVGAAGQLTAPVATGSAGMEPSRVILMIMLGAVVGYAAIVLPLLLPRVRERDRQKPTDYRWRFAFPAEARRILARLVVAVIAAVVVCAALGLHHVTWVLLAAIGVLQKDSNLGHSTIRMLQRLVGTTLAISVVALFDVWTPEGLVLVAVVAVLTFGFVALLKRNLLFALATVTPMALLLASGGSRMQLLAVTDIRVVDTMVGAGIAAAVLGAVALGRRGSAPRRREQDSVLGVGTRRAQLED
ncbi:FUSC family protein [Microbacterium sp. 1P10UB]|uniref:FUSC family protein n=1 Tax=unclassified Microbacterium TaxID=2609290 RepID=UPI0039A2AFEC